MMNSTTSYLDHLTFRYRHWEYLIKPLDKIISLYSALDMSIQLCIPYIQSPHLPEILSSCTPRNSSSMQSFRVKGRRSQRDWRPLPFAEMRARLEDGGREGRVGEVPCSGADR